MMTMLNLDTLKASDVHQYGDFYKLNYFLDPKKILETLSSFEDKWSQYNPRKNHIRREGLCVFNYDGKCGPGPALDSVKAVVLPSPLNVSLVTDTKLLAGLFPKYGILCYLHN